MFYSTTRLSVPATLLVYSIVGVFIFWLDFVSNVFTMGYFTPWPREVAILTVSATLLVALYFSRRKISWLPASLILLHVGLIAYMWILDYQNMLKFEKFR
jgi:hypothetical protein